MGPFVRRRTLGALLLLAAALAPATPLHAQQAPALPPPVILIVDMAEILQQAKAAQEVHAILNKQYTAYSKEVAAQEDELQKGGTELERQRTVMAPDAYNGRTSCSSVTMSSANRCRQSAWRCSKASTMRWTR